MAAEHLTKKKLIQLLVVLFVLIAAFTLRTCNYKNNEIKKGDSTENSKTLSEKTNVDAPLKLETHEQ